ncbi:MAG: LacI family DNA-binding transcriptional regulator [Lentisphaeria bacterium]|jgi:LacI family transcriptional regulator
MKKNNLQRVSIRAIAVAAGISKTTVSDALRNHPGVNPATQARVLRLAKQLGYVPDARIASVMASVREAATKELLPIAWLNTNLEQDAWQKYQFHAPYLEGARERARQLGYRLEEIWLHEPGMTMPRLSRRLHRRGIEGVIVTPTATHLQLDWDRLAGVSIGKNLLVPHLHRITADLYYNFLLALKMVKRGGYQRIGICLTDDFDRGTDHACRIAAHHFQATIPECNTVPPLFYNEVPTRWPAAKRQIVAWLSRCKPDVVVCQSNRLVACVEAAGFRVPMDVGVVHLATDDDVSDWAGVCSNRRETGAIAAELVVSFMRSRQFGVPRIARDTIIRGSWHPGRTLLIPKPE